MDHSAHSSTCCGSAHPHAATAGAEEAVADFQYYISITDAPLDASTANAWVSHPSCGAIVNFIGTTRENHGGKSVTKLEYEAAPSMARKMLADICDAANETSGRKLRRVYVAHRTGEVLIEQASVIITVSSPHRKEALQAVNYIIDELKAKVPIWKKEWYADGSCSWKENCECLLPAP
jgi:molybdopterin synthase catalytic subunit